jgi:hypothetical protein
VTANRVLAASRGLSEEDIAEVDKIHEQLEGIIEKRVGMGFNLTIEAKIKELEFRLQRLWRFPEDSAYHTWAKRYEFKCLWAFRKWRCNTTGEVFEIPLSVEERDFFIWGDQDTCLDVGRLNMYARFSNCTEVC